jgi:hypothetical protein
MSGLLRAAEYQQVSDGDLHGLTILIQSCGSKFDQSEVWARLRWPRLEDFTLEVQRIAWPRRMRPPKLIETRSNDATRRAEVTLDQQAHGDCGSMPATRYQAMKNRVLRCRRVEMERLWIELGGKTSDPLFVDAQAAGAEGLSDGKILKISLSHYGKPLIEEADVCCG